uniref:Uncharacterized protein n=1 Tax=Romanomermis culicivorax TaxID=13658 RepID=A0A915I511_ROMCU
MIPSGRTKPPLDWPVSTTTVGFDVLARDFLAVVAEPVAPPLVATVADEETVLSTDGDDPRLPNSISFKLFKQRKKSSTNRFVTFCTRINYIPAATNNTEIVQLCDPKLTFGRHF